jgi:hypothetical protein
MSAVALAEEEAHKNAPVRTISAAEELSNKKLRSNNSLKKLCTFPFLGSLSFSEIKLFL